MMIDNFVRSWSQHWIAVILLFAVSVGIVLFPAWLVTPTWEGQGTMEIQQAPTPSQLVTSNELTPVASLTASQLAKNLAEQTHSLSFLREVVERSGLAAHYQQNAEARPDARMRIKKAIVYVTRLQFLRGSSTVNYSVKALEDLQSSWLSITPTEGSTVIPIYVYGDDPKITKKVGNTIMDLLQERTNDAIKSNVQQQAEVVAKLVEEAQKRVSSNDQALEAARMQYQFFDPQSYAQKVQEALQGLIQEKTTFQAQADGLTAKVTTLEQQLADVEEFVKMKQEGVGTTDNNSLSSRIQKDIADAKAEIAQKTLTQGPNSPAVRSLEVKVVAWEKSLADAQRDEARLDRSQSNVRDMVDPKHTALFNAWIDSTLQLSALRARFAALDQAIAALADMQREAIKADIALKRMQRDSQADEAQLQMLTSQLRQLNNLLATPRLFTGIVSRNDMQVVNENKNDYPSMALAMILALAIGIFAALVLPIAYDYLNQTLLTSRQVAGIPGVRVVASVPRVGSSKMFASV